MAQAEGIAPHGYRTACWIILASGVVGLLALPNLSAFWQWGKTIRKVGLRQLIFHFRRVRKLRSCSICARVIQPRECYKLCGSCAFLCCSQCGQRDKASHKHLLHDEVQPLVVDTLALASAKCAGQALEASFRLYSSRPCLGWRAGNSYAWHSYCEIGRMSSCCASRLQTLLRQLSAQLSMPQGTHVVGLLSAVGVPWFTVDFACSIAAIPLVTMHRATDDEALAHILDTTGLCILVASRQLTPVIHRASARASASQLRLVIWIEDSFESYCLQFSSRPLTEEEAAQAPSWQQKEFQDLLREGSEESGPLTVPAFRDPKRVAKLLPSSGSTGKPKVAVVTEEALFKDSSGRNFESQQGCISKSQV